MSGGICAMSRVLPYRVKAYPTETVSNVRLSSLQLLDYSPRYLLSNPRKYTRNPLSVDNFLRTLFSDSGDAGLWDFVPTLFLANVDIVSRFFVDREACANETERKALVAHLQNLFVSL